MEFQQTQLSDFEEKVDYTTATAGVRLANLIIDSVFYYVFVFLFVFSVLYTTNSREFAEQAENNEGIQTLIAFGIYILYFTLTETAFKGRTLGKFITGSKAVRLNGEKTSVSRMHSCGLYAVWYRSNHFHFWEKALPAGTTDGQKQ